MSSRLSPAERHQEWGTHGSYAEHDGVRIYYEVHGTGEPLLLCHGATSTGRHWLMAGYVDALAQRYRVIVMDARGHGVSDKPHEGSAYHVPIMVEDACAVLDAAGVGRVHYWGYSMGAIVGYALLARRPERVASMVFGGAGSGWLNQKARADYWLPGVDVYRSDNPSAYAQLRNGPNARPIEGFERNDFEALACWILGLVEWEGVDPSSLHAPNLHYVGTADRSYATAVEGARMMPGADLHEVPGLDHQQGFFRADLVLPIVTPFLARQPPVT